MIRGFVCGSFGCRRVELTEELLSRIGGLVMGEKVSRLPDAIAGVKQALGALESELAEPGMEREAVLGLKYRKGDRVRDKVTGKSGTVIAGTRKAVTVRVPGSEGR